VQGSVQGALPLLEARSLSTRAKLKDVCSYTPPHPHYISMIRSLCTHRIIPLPLVSEENLSKKPQLEKLGHNIQEKLDALSGLRDSYDSLNQEYQRLSGKYAPDSIKVSLVFNVPHMCTCIVTAI
jgi:hypothetical protein